MLLFSPLLPFVDLRIGLDLRLLRFCAFDPFFDLRIDFRFLRFWRFNPFDPFLDLRIDLDLRPLRFNSLAPFLDFRIDLDPFFDLLNVLDLESLAPFLD